MFIKLSQHLIQQMTLKLYKLVNKIIFRSNNAKHHFDQWQFKAKFLYCGEKIEPQEFEIFQFKNCKQKQNQVVTLK